MCIRDSISTAVSVITESTHWRFKAHQLSNTIYRVESCRTSGTAAVMTSMEKIKQLEAQMEGLVLRVKVVEEERKKAIEDMGTLERRLEDAKRANQNYQNHHQGQSGTNRISENRPIYFPGPNSRPPKFPSTYQLKLPIGNSG